MTRDSPVLRTRIHRYFHSSADHDHACAAHPPNHPPPSIDGTLIDRRPPAALRRPCAASSHCIAAPPPSPPPPEPRAALEATQRVLLLLLLVCDPDSRGPERAVPPPALLLHRPTRPVRIATPGTGADYSVLPVQALCCPRAGILLQAPSPLCVSSLPDPQQAPPPSQRLVGCWPAPLCSLHEVALAHGR